jgi:hypothetical protein
MSSGLFALTLLSADWFGDVLISPRLAGRTLHDSDSRLMYGTQIMTAVSFSPRWPRHVRGRCGCSLLFSDAAWLMMEDHLCGARFDVRNGARQFAAAHNVASAQAGYLSVSRFKKVVTLKKGGNTDHGR